LEGVSKRNKLYEEIEDIKGVIRISKSRKDRQHNGQKKKEKRTNNDLQKNSRSSNTNPTKTGCELRYILFLLSLYSTIKYA